MFGTTLIRTARNVVLMADSYEDLPLVYSCSGCSSAAQMANVLAVELDRERIAEMSCIAGVGATSDHSSTQRRPGGRYSSSTVVRSNVPGRVSNNTTWNPTVTSTSQNRGFRRNIIPTTTTTKQQICTPIWSSKQ